MSASHSGAFLARSTASGGRSGALPDRPSRPEGLPQQCLYFRPDPQGHGSFRLGDKMGILQLGCWTTSFIVNYEPPAGQEEARNRPFPPGEPVNLGNEQLL